MDQVTNDARERAFLGQRELFVQTALKALRHGDLNAVADVASRNPYPLSPIILPDYRRLTHDQVADIARDYHGPDGVAHFIVLNPSAPGTYSHPIFELAEQLRHVLPLSSPVDHPMEGHPEAVARFGPSDGTLKIYDLEIRDSARYREQAETSEMFDAHNDGLGYAGAVEAVIFFTDSAPLWGGYTYFQNVVALSLCLARKDPDAFASLFLPDAITALRPRGKGAIKVTSPVLFMNEQGEPQTFFRISSGEYQVTHRTGCSPLERAFEFLSRHCQPFAPASTFVHFDRAGAGCILRNGWVVHGRTRFIDGVGAGQKRVLARKWFMTAPQHARYKHVPGMHIMEQFASIYPEQFGAELLNGEWNYDPSTGVNVRKG